MQPSQPSPPFRLKDRIKGYLDALLLDLRSAGERGRLVRETVITLALRMGALGIAFIASIIYARTLKASGYGIYAYVIAWYDVTLIGAGLGLQEYLVREASKDKRPGRLRGILHWADKRVLAAGLIGAATMSAVGFVVPGAEGMGPLFLIAAWLPMLAALATVRQSMLRASDAVVASQWPPVLLAPTLMLALILIWWWALGDLAPGVLIGAMLVSLALTLLVQELQVRRRLGAEAAVSVGSLSLRGALPFMWLAAIWYVNSRVDLLILGSLKSHADVGVYAVVVRVAGLVVLATYTVNTVIAPRIAAYYHQGEHARLQRLVEASTRRTFLLCLPPALLLIFAGGPLLQLAFGAEYARGWAALAILTVAQLINVVSGPTGVILYMAGLERVANRTFMLSAILNAVLNFALVPKFGIVGAAGATSLSLVAWNLVLWREVRVRLSLRPTAIGI